MAELFFSRKNYIQWLFLACGLLLIGKAFQLQILNHDPRQADTGVAVEQYTLYPARGLVYDRHDELLITNTPMYDLLVTHNQLDPAMDTLKFCRLLGIERAHFEANINKDWRSPRYSKSLPFVFLSKISAKRFARLRESLYEFPGFEVQKRNARDYPEETASHLLGFIREVNQQEIKEHPDRYAPGDYIGASGLEQAYESDLRGEKGTSLVLKDNVGRIVAPFLSGNEDQPPKSGQDLIASIDLDLQAYGEKLMQNKIGGIVAIEPATGEILAMVSAPTYNPRDLTINNNNRGEAYQQLNEDPNKPLFNRAIMAQYPPGSLFKPLLALIALEEETARENRTLPCYGGYVYNGQLLMGCHNHPTCRGISDAIQYSCNNYFVHIFRETVDQFGFTQPGQGLDTLNAYLKRFGMGRKLGIDFPGEKPGNIPTSTYFDQWYEGQKWNSIWIRSLGIGQGEYLTTNLQLANMAAMIANRGWFIPPHLVKGYRFSAKPIDPIYQEPQYTGISQHHFEPVIDGMEGAVRYGTARSAYIPDIPICGKTGTAENPFGEDHSIFFCFAPRENPQIALVVYVENSGFGGTYAAPIASLMIEKYLKGEIRGPARAWLENRILKANLLPVQTP